MKGRLVYFQTSPDADFWDRHWAGMTQEVYHDAREGRTGFFDSIYAKWLPKDGKILEAGCGMSQQVMALRALGYDCEGVEWGEKTVERVHELCPELPVHQGDVTALNVPDGYYRGYISLGVMEHRKQGPEPFIREARRVVCDDGVFLISVPHFHILRRMKAWGGMFRGDEENLEFYQNAYTVKEFQNILDREGLRVLDTFGYDAQKGLKDEIPGFLRLYDIPWFGKRFRKALRIWPILGNKFGHMIMFVCQKKTSGGIL